MNTQKWKTFLGCGAVVLAGLLLTGCMNNPGEKTVAGSTLVGAGTGAAIGGLVGGGTGAAIGALAGAGGGALTGVGINAANQGNTSLPVAERTRKDPRYAISPFTGQTLWVGGAATGQRMRDSQGREFIVGDVPR
jgi:uncharacterized protein YcfJ